MTEIANQTPWIFICFFILNLFATYYWPDSENHFEKNYFLKGLVKFLAFILASIITYPIMFWLLSHIYCDFTYQHLLIFFCMDFVGTTLGEIARFVRK